MTYVLQALGEGGGGLALKALPPSPPSVKQDLTEKLQKPGLNWC